jgi:hypothetical protein
MLHAVQSESRIRIQDRLEGLDPFVVNPDTTRSAMTW